MKKVLIVDDEDVFSTALQTGLEFENYRVFLANNCTDALKFCAEMNPHVVLLDIQLGKESGVKLAKDIIRVQGKWDSPRIIIMSGIFPPKIIEALEEHTQHNLVYFLNKPFKYNELSELLKKCLTN